MAKDKVKEEKKSSKGKDAPAAKAKDTKAKAGGNLPARGPKDGEVGVDYVAKTLGVTAATMRAKLRKESIEVSDNGSYSWTKEFADKKVIPRFEDKADKKAA